MLEHFHLITTAAGAGNSLLRGKSGTLITLLLMLSTTACSTAGIEARPLAETGAEIVGASNAGEDYEKGRSYLVAGRYGLALQSLFAALRQDPNAVRTLNAIAITYDQLGRYDLSHRYYDEALARDPSSPATLNNVAYSCLRQGRRDWAMDYLRRAALVAQNDPTTIAGNLEAALRAEPSAADELALDENREGRGGAISEAASLPRIERLSSVLQEVVSRPMAPSKAARVIPLIPDPAQAATGAASVAIWNGAGRRRLAARMRLYLARFGITGASIGNADRFSYQTSVISYRPGFEENARRISAALPRPIMALVDPRLPKDIVLVLGRDLMSFSGDVQVAQKMR